MRNRVSQSFSFPNRVWERELEHFLNVRLDEFIIMPNHLHGIIIFVGVKHSNKEFSKNLHYRQKNASPLLIMDSIHYLNTIYGKSLDGSPKFSGRTIFAF